MAVSQVGSRAGLITALVIFVILFFIAAIFAVYKGLEDKEKEARLTTKTQMYQKTISEQEMTGPDYQAIAALQDDPNVPEYQNLTVFGILLSQRNALASKLMGQPSGAREAVRGIDRLIAASNAKLKETGVVVPGASMAAAISFLTDAVMQRQAQVMELSKQLAAANEDMKKQAQAFQAEIDKHRQNLEMAKAEAAAAGQQSAEYRQTKDEQVAKLEKDLVDAIEKAHKAEESFRSQLAAKDEQIQKLQKDVERLVAVLERYRPKTVTDTTIRRADGQVIRLARENVVYINLGLGQQITPGMTFQVYDRDLGIPKAATLEEAATLPVGKGSLEVIKVGSGSSECRVIKLMPGQQIIEGDLVANLIYDPNVKLKFKVYGEFDIDQNGVATAAEADIVKRLIVQWGGALVEDVTIDTDFVVMGKEPVVPRYTAEQLAGDPVAQFNVEKATKALAAYEEVRNKALGTRVPVLNQNRFLYLIGFFDQAKK